METLTVAVDELLHDDRLDNGEYIIGGPERDQVEVADGDRTLVVEGVRVELQHLDGSVQARTYTKTDDGAFPTVTVRRGDDVAGEHRDAEAARRPEPEEDEETDGEDH